MGQCFPNSQLRFADPNTWKAPTQSNFLKFQASGGSFSGRFWSSVNWEFVLNHPVEWKQDPKCYTLCYVWDCCWSPLFHWINPRFYWTNHLKSPSLRLECPFFSALFHTCPVPSHPFLGLLARQEPVVDAVADAADARSVPVAEGSVEACLGGSPGFPSHMSSVQNPCCLWLECTHILLTNHTLPYSRPAKRCRKVIYNCIKFCFFLDYYITKHKGLTSKAGSLSTTFSLETNTRTKNWPKTDFPSTSRKTMGMHQQKLLIVAARCNPDISRSKGPPWTSPSQLVNGRIWRFLLTLTQVQCLSKWFANSWTILWGSFLFFSTVALQNRDCPGLAGRGRAPPLWAVERVALTLEIHHPVKTGQDLWTPLKCDDEYVFWARFHDTATATNIVMTKHTILWLFLSGFFWEFTASKQTGLIWQSVHVLITHNPGSWGHSRNDARTITAGCTNNKILQWGIYDGCKGYQQGCFFGQHLWFVVFFGRGWTSMSTSYVGYITSHGAICVKIDVSSRQFCTRFPTVSWRF